uniref:Uncharacterized protein n=1 Tax=Strongyloides stercoralis TaxID=6248 RepID=A0AAF5DKB9_STRER
MKKIIQNLQYAHNFSYCINQEGKPKEYILSTIDRYTQEHYLNSELSGRRNLLQFIKSQMKPKTADPSSPNKTHKKTANNTIVYKKLPSAHKNEEQFSGPYKIIQHLHGNTYLIAKVTKSN